MDREQLKSFILDNAYYDEVGNFVAIVKKEELAKLLKVDVVEFDD